MRRPQLLIRSVVAAVLVLAGSLAATSPASADNVLAGNLHWERFGYNNAYYYVEDFTGADWPVYASQVWWNYSANVGAYYASPGNCPSTCVPAYEGYYGTGFYAGYFQWNVDGNGHFIADGVTQILYNNSYNLTSGQRRSLTCQEQGHALGLDHRNETIESCMWQDVGYYPSNYPDDHDYYTVDNVIYNH